ncbi:hypothetical protein GWI72_06545 [Microvirga tunisiensis]|uniref:DUF945 domain-containing protein n=1 Tax=Pannonibacter tanglangensis TaxID=2750084 RepID=A0A7X5J8W7_9HYPH|nr:hypothetical protein [Pannonibacter sp. XCT-53]NBN77926.1 hypothetical protein [Pannonibacter sp. XCT-53]
MRSLFLRGASAAALGLFLTSGALAFDPTGNAAADAFLKRLEAGETKIVSVGDVSEDGDQVSIESIVLADSKPEGDKMEIGVATLTAAEEQADGKLAMDGLALEELTLTSDGTVMTLAQLVATEVTLPSVADLAKADSTATPGYSTVEIEGVTILDKDKTEVGVESIYLAANSMEGNWPTSGELQVTGIALTAAQMEEEAKKQLTELGYDKLSFDIASNFTWSPQTGDLDFPQFDLTGADMGSLALAFKIGGLTADVVKKLEAAKDNSEESMALLQGLSVSSLRLRFENASLVDRVLDQQAKAAGTDRAAFVTQLKAGMPMMLALLQNPDFQTSVSTALSSFLDKPGSLTVEAKPAQPVPVAQIMGTAMLAPQTLPQVLGVAVTANTAP